MRGEEKVKVKYLNGRDDVEYEGVSRFALDMETGELYVISWFSDGMAFLYRAEFSTSQPATTWCFLCTETQEGSSPSQYSSFLRGQRDCPLCREESKPCVCSEPSRRQQLPKVRVDSWSSFLALARSYGRHALGVQMTARCMDPSSGTIVNRKRAILESKYEAHSRDSFLDQTYKRFINDFFPSLPPESRLSFTLRLDTFSQRDHGEAGMLGTTLMQISHSDPPSPRRARGRRVEQTKRESKSLASSPAPLLSEEPSRLTEPQDSPPSNLDTKEERCYSCAYCGKDFTRKVHLEAHMTAIHEKRKPFDCEHCSSSFVTRSNLARHIRAVHEKLKNFSCEVCNFSCNRRCDLTRHRRLIHSLGEGCG